LILNREQRANAISSDLLRAFMDMEQEVARAADLRALVVTGKGKSFCAGADLAERRGMSRERVREQLASYPRAFGWLEASPRPVVAAINGAALGGGLELALMCDLRIAAPSAVLGLPETRLGIIPGAGGTQRLPRIVGPARAKELILLGERIDARRALSIGLVHRVSSSDETLLDETLNWIQPIEHGAPVAQAAALAALDAASEVSLAEGLAIESREYERCLVTEDREEALLAFAEKRAPAFKGR
jgi:enoyl-CoA hydratase/carnithine racemase